MSERYLKMNSTQIKKKAFLQAAVNFFDSASSHAESGDIDAAALLILKALDQERRALVVGPQILHLIKPIS